MGYLERYVAEENAAEYQAGRITHSELLRRLTLLTGSAVAAVALAVTLGCSSSEPTPTLVLDPTTTVPSAAPAAPTVTTPATAVHGTVTPNDPAIEADGVTFKHGDITLMSYLAKPRAAGQHPAVLIIHENRGLLPHFPDVARRYAKAGYVALSLDLLSCEGGTALMARCSL